ncbi:hypothetical protein DEO72_LG6g1202 [Vigna unguiculata]|uniref:Uncharacterized protein n=1 Tax=Vigna unguiculata TaxID=3917 RepID=A0A4D6M7F7_VIGUN|nr:hypothetical protein DEO72_LG6g1202 [Vigna unguiculata]
MRWSESVRVIGAGMVAHPRRDADLQSRCCCYVLLRFLEVRSVNGTSAWRVMVLTRENDGGVAVANAGMKVEDVVCCCFSFTARWCESALLQSW